MPYLIGKAQNTFEYRMTARRGPRSSQLNAAIAAVKKYLDIPTAGNIRHVKFCWDYWKKGQPGEFAGKAAMIQADFEAELLVEYRMRGIKVDPDVAPEPLGFPNAPQTAINGWTYTKYGVKTGIGATSLAVSAAQTATGQGLGTLAQGLILGTGAAVSATGVGLIAAGLAVTVGTSALSAIAAVKSADHRDKLIEIYEQKDKAPLNEEKYCQVVMPGSPPKTRQAYMAHDMIANHVLPYIIYQKDRKFKRRAFGAIPIIGSLESVRGAGNYLYKKYVKGPQGALRNYAAGWLALHLITCNCLLVQKIVAELYSAPEMEWLKYQYYQVVIGHLERKLKST
jgi:hypothetical protein